MASALSDVLLRASAAAGPVRDNEPPGALARALMGLKKGFSGESPWEGSAFRLGRKTAEHFMDKPAFDWGAFAGPSGERDDPMRERQSDVSLPLVPMALGGGIPFAPRGSLGIAGGRLVQPALAQAEESGVGLSMRPKFNNDKFLIYRTEDPALPPRSQPRFRLGEDGALEAVVPKGWNPGAYSSAYRDQAFQFLDKELAPKYDHFWRFTDNKGELALLQNRTLRPSFNYMDNLPEKGLSVAEGAHYGAQPYKYGYGVRGNVLARGSDGEPILDLGSAQAVTPIMQKSRILTKDAELARESAARRGWEPGDMKRFIRSLMDFK